MVGDKNAGPKLGAAVQLRLTVYTQAAESSSVHQSMYGNRRSLPRPHVGGPRLESLS